MNTKIKDIEGMIVLRDKRAYANITARFTSDEIGETISLADERAGLMLVVPFEPVFRMITEARTERAMQNGKQKT